MIRSTVCQQSTLALATNPLIQKRTTHVQTTSLLENTSSTATSATNWCQYAVVYLTQQPFTYGIAIQFAQPNNFVAPAYKTSNRRWVSANA